MIIGRSGDAPEPFKPRQPKMLPHDWSPGSPDANVLLAAGRYRQGLRPVNAFTARDATTLDICKHHVLIVSLDSLAELHAEGASTSQLSAAPCPVSARLSCYRPPAAPTGILVLPGILLFTLTC